MRSIVKREREREGGGGGCRGMMRCARMGVGGGGGEDIRGGMQGGSGRSKCKRMKGGQLFLTHF